MEPLYRRVNTRARNVRHDRGGDFRHRRNTEAERASDVTRGPMTGRRRGLDYTPLFRFLLSKVGEDWGEVFDEAAKRLRKVDPDLGPESMARSCACCTHTFNGVRYGEG